MKKDPTDNPNKFQKVAQQMAKRLEREFGKDCGFAILVWKGGKLNHVTTSRNELAEVMAVQLSTWAQEMIKDEDRAVALARQAQGAPVNHSADSATGPGWLSRLIPGRTRSAQ